MIQKKYIIVGQGIAGTCLAHQFHQQGTSFIVVDDSHYRSASKVAAGIVNPVVFKRLTKSWMVDQVLPVATQFYLKIQDLLGENVFEFRDIVRIFSSTEEQNNWFGKSEDNAMGKYLSEQKTTLENTAVIESGLGGGTIIGAGNVKVAKLITSYREWLRSKQLLLDEKLDHKELKIEKERVNYKGIEASAIIFAEGMQALSNPYFNWLPFVLSKGELITIEAQCLNTEQIINKGFFILPLGNDRYKVGATYQWNDLTDEPTKEAKEYLMDKLRNTISTPFEVIRHEVGIRPTVKDRRPFLGVHPSHEKVHIFNGFGTKAVMLAPYFAHHLIQFLELKRPLIKEVDIKRYAHLLTGGTSL